MSHRERLKAAGELLDEACSWRLLSILFSRPRAESLETVEQLAREVRDPALVQAAFGWRRVASEGTYLALLGPGGAVPARECAYRAFADPGWLLADIARYHAAFGFHSTAEEPPDHVAVLCELVAYLWLKEAYARECGDDGAAMVTAAARTALVGEHLSPIAVPLADKLSACGTDEWAVAAQLLAERVPAPPPVARMATADERFGCESCIGSDPQL